MEMTRERISFTFDPRDRLLSLQMGFSFVRAAVACAILERTSGLEPSSKTTAPRYLKLFTVPNTCLFTFISLWMPSALFVISLVFSALISMLFRVQVLSRLSTRASSPCSASARASIQGWQKGGKYSYFPGRREILVIPGNYWEICPSPIRKF